MSNFTNFNAEIYAALNVASITTLLDTYGASAAIFAASVMPEDFDGVKSINFYRTAPIDNSIEYGDGKYSASCRAETENESLTIAAAVVNAINRVTYVNYYLKTSIFTTIKPEDHTDTYNTPVEITIFKR